MRASWDRRDFLKTAGSAGLLIGLAGVARSNQAEQKGPRVADHTLTVIGGKPRERGRQYGAKFKDSIRSFLDREILEAFVGKPASREELIRYAGACGKAVKTYTPIVFDELEGMAEASGLRLEEALLLTLHEELYHRKPLPQPGHCTVVAAGPPETADGQTYIGQTWDWMASIHGLSNLLRWERPEGPSLLTYAYPGLWVGAGVSAAGLAFGWTSAWDQEKIPGPRVGIPAYVLIAHLLYQESLDAVVEEARRAEHAGWFTLVFADDRGGFVNLEVTPKERAIERGQGRFARNAYGTRQLTRTAADQPVKHTPKARRMYDLLEAGGKLDREKLQAFLGDPAICVPPNKSGFTVDSMLFNTAKREAWITRGPATPGRWQRFTLDGKA